MYRLLGPDGFYFSEEPGTLGGRVYGTMDCPAALAALRKTPDSYKKRRVFFADERTALAAGFRPCGRCLREKMKEYTADPQAYRAKFGLD